MQAVPDRRGGAVRVGRDLCKPVHRRYPGLLADDVRTAGALVRPDTAAGRPPSKPTSAPGA
ncbi:zeta toxin family protein [Streptomyces bottropensis]|uniref:Zeta toxin domain-containing protein n=1 Tax=Streptomyces bottropensis ATCC 25435 TaxID=1054862 RepID=M3FU88_9ACTN|nr:hypothetical protein SBD_2101 [Streptomyces bottropensis ATCC 25435]